MVAMSKDPAAHLGNADRSTNWPNQGCPYCAGRKVNKENSLKFLLIPRNSFSDLLLNLLDKSNENQISITNWLLVFATRLLNSAKVGNI